MRGQKGDIHLFARCKKMNVPFLTTTPASRYSLRMPRTARAAAGGLCYHAINRGNGRTRVFHNKADYRDFERLLATVGESVPMRLLAYCLMPNHFHLVLWPHNDGDLGRWMQRLLTAHVRRHHRRHGTDGRIWQGRFKAFPIQADGHLLTVMRYVERNPLRANLVARAEDWRWSSLGGDGASPVAIDPGPTPRPTDWRDWVNAAESQAELEAVRLCTNRGRPMGDARWTERTANRLGLESTLRPRGRPRKNDPDRA